MEGQRFEPRNPFLDPIPDRSVYVITNVHDYLAKIGREDLCPDLYNCDKWKVEPVLLEHLDKQKRAKSKNTQLARGIIRALSNFPPNRDSDEEVLRALGTEKRLKEDLWEKIEEIFGSIRFGDDPVLEEAVQAVESEYASLMKRWHVLEDSPMKDELRKEIERLRPIRDRLYLRRVHPAYAKSVNFPDKSIAHPHS